MKKSKYLKKGYDCIEKCGNKVCQEGNKCRSCSTKERLKNPRNNSNYKDGKSIYRKNGFKCLEKNCKNKVCQKGRRCQSCSAKLRFSIPKNNPRYIDGRSIGSNPTFSIFIKKVF